MKASTVLLGVLLAVAAAPTVEVQAQAQTRTPATTTVAFRNDLPSSYRLERVRLFVDGRLRYDSPTPFNAALAPGDHVVSVVADYRMHDPVLTYYGGYRVQLHSAERVRSASPHALVARAVERGGVTTPFERRAQIVWR
jgi:hypothetical protein